MSEKKVKIEQLKAKPLKQFVTDDDISWIKSAQIADINKVSGDEIYAAKSAHAARRFKQNLIYNTRRTNVFTNKKQFSEELDFHASRMGWWDQDYEGPLIKNISKEYQYIQ